MRPASLIAIVACAACAGRQPAPVAAPPPPPPAAPAPAEPARQQDRVVPLHSDGLIRVCVLRDGWPERVGMRYNPATGDTTYQGVPLSQAFPLSEGYAEQAEWFVTNEPIPFGQGRRYVRYGYARVLGEREVVRVGEYRGVGLFVETGRTENPEVIYVPVRHGCEFQPYMINSK